MCPGRSLAKKTLISNIIPNIIPLSAVQLVAISLFIELSESQYHSAS